MERFRARARQLRRAETGAEGLLWQGLRNRRLDRRKFRRQHPIDRYIVDFVTIFGKLIVEVDGATHGTLRDIEHDAQRTRDLEALGFRVIRVLNDDVYRNLPAVLDHIWAELNPGQV